MKAFDESNIIWFFWCIADVYVCEEKFASSSRNFGTVKCMVNSVTNLN